MRQSDRWAAFSERERFLLKRILAFWDDNFCQPEAAEMVEEIKELEVALPAIFKETNANSKDSR